MKIPLILTQRNVFISFVRIKCILIILFLLFGTVMASEREISDLTDQELKNLNDMRSVVEKNLNTRFLETEYQTSLGKLGIIQSLLDNNTFSKSQQYELQALGVIIGDAFIKEMDFHWVIIDYGYGREPVIEYKGTSIHLFPLSIVSNLIENYEKIDVIKWFHDEKFRVRQLIKLGY